MIPEIIARAVDLELITSSETLELADKEQDDVKRGKLFALLVATRTLDEDQTNHAHSQALGAAQQISVKSGPPTHGDILEILLPYLPENLLKDAIISLLEVSSQYYGKDPLGFMVPHITPIIWDTIVDYIETLPPYVPFQTCQLDILKKLAPYFPSDYIPKAWATCIEIAQIEQPDSTQFQIAKTIQAFIPHLPQGEIETALNLAMNMSADLACSKTLAVMAFRLSGNLLDKVIDYALNYKGRLVTTRALVLSATLPQRPELIKEAYKATLKSSKTVYWLEVLDYLLPHLSQTQLTEIYRRTMRLPPRGRIEGISKLLPFLDEKLHLKALKVAINSVADIRAGDPDSIDEEYQVLSINQIAPFIDIRTIDFATDFVLTVKSNRERCSMLVDLADRASGERRDEILSHALEAALGSPQTYAPHALVGDRSASIRLAPYLSGGLLERAYEAFVAPPTLDEFEQQLAQTSNAVVEIKSFIKLQNDLVLAILAPQLSAQHVQPLLKDLTY